MAPHGPRPADPPLKEAREAQRRPNVRSARRGERIQDTYTAYDDFPWQKIEEFLRVKWPNWDFKVQRFNDKWVFEVPEELTEGDRRELRNRRDAPKRTRRASISTEPEDGQDDNEDTDDDEHADDDEDGEAVDSGERAICDREAAGIRHTDSEHVAEGSLSQTPTIDHVANTPPVWNRVITYIRHFVRPRIPEGYERLEWTCECGEKMYGDYKNDDPVSLRLFAASLQGLAQSDEPISVTVEIDQGERTGRLVQLSDNTSGSEGINLAQVQDAARSSPSSAFSPSAQLPAPLPPNQVAANASSNATWIPIGGSCPQVTAPPAKRFFELCVNTGLLDIRLGEIDITDVTTDGQLFERIYQTYKNIRGHRIKRIFVRPTNIHFVLFIVEDGHRVGISKTPDAIPSEDEMKENKYEYKPCPLKNPPPIPPQIFFHHMKKHETPGNAQVHSKAIWLTRLPKRVGQRFLHESEEPVFGWGVHIIESLHEKAIALAGCFILLVSLLVSLLYAHFAKTEEQGFAIGAFLVAVLGVATTAVYFHSIET